MRVSALHQNIIVKPMRPYYQWLTRTDHSGVPATAPDEAERALTHGAG